VLNTEIRLFSRQRRAPVDVVAREHREVHEQLELWARSGRERRKAATCGSLERLYLKGGRDTPPASTAPAPVNGLRERIEAIVLALAPQHSQTLRLYYLQRWPTVAICRIVGLRFEMFEGWVYSCREMVRVGLAAMPTSSAK
jgi:hypothetical protein